jgi:NADPH:quinone reductase-like Zn-dependent oxidoreductase
VKALKPRGVYLSTVLSLRSRLRGIAMRLTSGKRIAGGFSQSDRVKLRTITDLVDRGALRPVSDRVYALTQLADAHRYVEQGHKRGSVVVEV